MIKETVDKKEFTASGKAQAGMIELGCNLSRQWGKKNWKEKTNQLKRKTHKLNEILSIT